MLSSLASLSADGDDGDDGSGAGAGDLGAPPLALCPCDVFLAIEMFSRLTESLHALRPAPMVTRKLTSLSVPLDPLA